MIDEMFSILFLATLAQATTSASSSVAFILNKSTAVTNSNLVESVRCWRILWAMATLCLVCSIGSYTWLRKDESIQIRKKPKKFSGFDTIEDPPLIKKHSLIKTYSTASHTYPSIRTFHHAHPQADKLPKESGALPLLVFVHGLGGSLAQFAYMLSTLIHVGPCMGIDLPGCGLSELLPRDWNAYKHEALVELLELAIQQVCDASKTREVILIGHSMGCSLSVSLSLSCQRAVEGAFKVKGIVAICPKVSPIPLDQVKTFRRLLSIPSSIFNAWRAWDQRGGIGSASVVRFVGKQAHNDTKQLQLRFNQQSRTETFRRIARGALPLDKQKGLPGPEEWSRLSVPLFAVAGESDQVTPPKEVDIIIEALGKKERTTKKQDSDSPTPLDPECSSSGSTLSLEGKNKQSSILKTTILPAPASHGLIYDFATYRTLSGLIQDFMSNHIDHRLSLGWQLQRLKESNKWDVKNLAKWQAVNPVSDLIANFFYALKTLRETDEIHSPKSFTTQYNTRIKSIIDISYESPVYNPQGLEADGIKYHKHPTVSKIPPTVDEVRDFISLVDQIQATTPTHDRRLIGVHCHYGFNRTGFFICTYLIERLGFSVQSAVDEFQKNRPPGIRHEHFLDTLFVRYCVGLKRASTL